MLYTYEVENMQQISWRKKDGRWRCFNTKLFKQVGTLEVHLQFWNWSTNHDLVFAVVVLEVIGEYLLLSTQMVEGEQNWGTSRWLANDYRINLKAV